MLHLHLNPFAEKSLATICQREPFTPENNMSALREPLIITDTVEETQM